MLDDESRQVDTAVQTRTIARILLRVGELPFLYGTRDQLTGLLPSLAQWRQHHFRPNEPLPKDVTAQTAKAPSLYIQDYNTFESEATAEYADPDFPVPLPTESLREMLQSLTATLSEVCASSVSVHCN